MNKGIKALYYIVFFWTNQWLSRFQHNQEQHLHIASETMQDLLSTGSNYSSFCMLLKEKPE